MSKIGFTSNQKVLFIIHDNYRDDNFFLLGIAYLSAVLQKAGAHVEAYCMDVFHYTNEDLANHLTNNEYDLIGISFMAACFNQTVRQLCSTINQHKKNAWLVLGGHGPTPIPDFILQTTQADIITIGEAEETILHLLACKINQGNLRDITGIAFRERNEVIINQRRPPIKKLDKIPFPLWEIFPMKKYSSCLKIFKHEPGDLTLAILTSRGCTNNCSFCFRLEHGLRLRSIDNIIAEMKILWEQYQINSYFFSDELFLTTKQRLLEFKKKLQQSGLSIKFSTNLRANMATQEVLDILWDCGCVFLNFGFESGNQKVLDCMNKRMDVTDNLSTLQLVKSDGRMGMGLNFIWNNFSDTEDTLRQNADLIMEYNTYDQCRTVRPTSPYPGCPLYYDLIKKGFLTGPKDFFTKFKSPERMVVNIMDNMSDEHAYKLLLEVNTKLILDHYRHTSNNMSEAKKLIQQLNNLYSDKKTDFVDIRHYSS